MTPSGSAEKNLEHACTTINHHLHYVSTLPGKTKMTYKQHILKSIITVRSQPLHFVQCLSFPILGKKFFYQSAVRKQVHTPTGF